ncbi:MAG TPA: DUF4031 domain-containing protein [Nocardioides sp.]
MALMLDPPNVPWRGRLWSHLASDESFEELHAFASALGVPARGFDGDHYDIPAEHYDAAVAAGAEPVRSRELVRRLTAAGLRRRKGRRQSPQPGRSTGS